MLKIGFFIAEILKCIPFLIVQGRNSKMGVFLSLKIIANPFVKSWLPLSNPPPLCLARLVIYNCFKDFRGKTPNGNWPAIRN